MEERSEHTVARFCRQAIKKPRHVSQPRHHKILYFMKRPTHLIVRLWFCHPGFRQLDNAPSLIIYLNPRGEYP